LTPQATSSAGARTTPQRRRIRQSPRPVAPRRVSGPASGRVAPAPAQPRTRPERETAKPRIRPARDPAKPRTRSGAGLAIKTRTGSFVRSLPDHPLLDRLIRGRVWIPLLGVMLAGIVAMQVEVLKLGASMGRSLQMTSELSAGNATLHESVASLSDDQRIEQLASSMGMVMPPPQSVGFLRAHRGGDVGEAIANIHQPNGGAFEMLTSNNGAVVTASSLAAWNDFGTTGTAGASTPTSASAAPASSATAGTSSTGSATASTGSGTARPDSTASTSPTGTTASGTSAPPDSTAASTASATSTTAGDSTATPSVTATSTGTSSTSGSVSPTAVAPASTSGTAVPGATPTPATSTASTSYSPPSSPSGASTGAVAVAPSTTSQGG
jgi:hypothetical protein